MSEAFDPERLPAALRPLVERALRDVDACEEAIEALEQHVRGGGASPDALVALALLTYHEAAELVLSQIERAAGRALSLLDEAERKGAAGQGVARLRALCRASLERERRRERRILARMERDRARVGEVVELAHRLLLRGDGDLAAELLRRADEAAPEAPPGPQRFA